MKRKASTPSGRRIAEKRRGLKALTWRVTQPRLPAGSFTETPAPRRLPARSSVRLSGSVGLGSIDPVA
ncbi:MAG: hypothetical protein NTZ05_15880 [Chloroflexi bacterium]|nr:hypothetical protein [Chloroflexota bacterium]